MGRTPCCDKNGLKKGPWTQEEDQKLIDYIQKYGYGNWRTLPKNAGLQRCGKSCRLRWTNYLRPDIKRGRFSFEEEETIIQLHSILGNKWSAIAARLPGRTDNEIKNYWNTHIRKRLLRMGIDPVTHSPRLDLLDLSSLMAPSILANPTNFSRLLGLQQPLINPQLLRLASSLFSTQNNNNNCFTLQNHQNPNSNPQIPNPNIPIQTPVPDSTTAPIPSTLPPDHATSFTAISDQFFLENLDWQRSNDFLVSNPTEDYQNNGYYDASNFGFESGPPDMSTPSSSTTPLDSYSNSNSNNYNSNVYSSTTEDEREISYCSSILTFDDISNIYDVNDLIMYN